MPGDGVQAEAVCSVYLWLSLSPLLCEGEHWVRGFGGWLGLGRRLFTLGVADV